MLEMKKKKLDQRKEDVEELKGIELEKIQL